MTIAELIDKQDGSEAVRDAIATILATETAAQQVLAPLADPVQDARLYALRVFKERTQPWTEFVAASQRRDEQIDVAPIVNVRFESANIDRGSSNAIDCQTYDGRFYVDCFGYGVAEGEGTGHIPGDRRAALEAQRAARLVRNILMAGRYTYLGDRDLVGRRLITSLESLDVEPPEEGVNVKAVRLVLEVRYLETAPQVQADVSGGLDIDITSLADGEVLAEVSFDAPSP